MCFHLRFVQRGVIDRSRWLLEAPPRSCAIWRCATRAAPPGTNGELRRPMIAIRSIFSVAVSGLLLAACASATRDANDDGSDRQTDELGAIPQQNHTTVCAGGKFRCK